MTRLIKLVVKTDELTGKKNFGVLYIFLKTGLNSWDAVFVGMIPNKEILERLKEVAGLYSSLKSKG